MLSPIGHISNTMNQIKLLSTLLSLSLLLSACSEDDDTTASNNSNCTSDIEFDDSRGDCDQSLSYTSQISISSSNGNWMISANSIPDHKVGLFGRVPGALNPNAVSPQSESYTITQNPQLSGSMVACLGPNGPQYRFGILFNGVELDPVAAEPWPHEGIMSPDVNWEWNLEALNVSIGLDCNNAHVQPSGQYHYHGKPQLYLDDLNLSTTEMKQIGFAADGFPVYYKYAYSDANDSTSAVVAMQSSYRLKSGQRPGDGESAPCGAYTGVYSNDYEYVDGLGSLDEANGRYGITPEYPDGIYYYVITDEFPAIPRYLKGSPSSSFGF